MAASDLIAPSRWQLNKHWNNRYLCLNPGTDGLNGRTDRKCLEKGSLEPMELRADGDSDAQSPLWAVAAPGNLLRHMSLHRNRI